MTSSSIPFTFISSSPPPPCNHQKSSIPVFYYGLVVVGSASLILAIYNFMILWWCTNQRRHTSPQQISQILYQLPLPSKTLMLNFWIRVSSTKKAGISEDQSHEYVHECPVCISAFEDEEEVRQLPRCKHSFHIACIDMWLHSHFDCPVCRAPVRILPFRQQDVLDQSENLRVVLLQGSMSV